MCTGCSTQDEIKCLATAKKGERCEVAGLCGDCDRQSAKRLLDFGFVKGSKVNVLEESGDGSVTVDLEGSRVCVCGNLSKKVNVTACPSKAKCQASQP
jgi:Fe2+ transport system protein FeoA